jgi:hypothetical protein
LGRRGWEKSKVEDAIGDEGRGEERGSEDDGT